MSNRIATLSLVGAAALAALAAPALSTPALADETAGAKTVGAMTFETRGIAVDSRQVLRQGGFATAGIVRWIATPDDPSSQEPSTAAIHNAGSVGALSLETLGLATSAIDVRRQGGARTAAAVTWTAAPAE